MANILENTEAAESTPEFGVPDDENPEWTKEDWKRAVRFKDLPAELQEIGLAMKTAAAREQAKARRVAVRLSPDVVEALRATGQGWQQRADDVLRGYFISHKAEEVK